MTKGAAYDEGDWFAVPLRDGRGYAVGRVVRDAGLGGLLGYFFGPRRPDLPDLKELEERLHPKDALMVRWFGDLSLVEGDWPILGQTTWRRDAWPIPAFGRYDEILGVGFRLEYEEPDLSEPSRQVRVSKEEAESLPRDGLLGSGAVELLLTDLVGDQAPS